MQTGYIENYLETVSKFEKIFLDFLDEDDFIENEIFDYLKDQKFEEDPNSLRFILNMISKIEKYHYRSSDFYNKIGKILGYYKSKILELFDNEEIFHIFKKNKRLLLHLFEENILIPNKTIKSIITNNFYRLRNYPEYFYTEFKDFYEEDLKEKVKQTIGDVTPEEFERNRKIGENENYICQLIRDDSIVEFIKYVNQTNFSLNNKFDQSIYETHSIFEVKEWYIPPTVIQYAAFFGSIQIFKYLLLNNVYIDNSIWHFAINSPKYEMIHILEENKKLPDSYDSYKIYVECLKMHNANLANYFYENLMNQEIKKSVNQFELALHYYSFNCFTDFDIKSSFKSALVDKKDKKQDPKFVLFYNFCQFDYLQIVDYILKNEEIDLNMKRIEKLNFFC